MSIELVQAIGQYIVSPICCVLVLVVVLYFLTKD